MKIQNAILILLCPLFLNACYGKEANIPAVEENLSEVEKKINTPAHTNNPSYTVTDMDLRLAVLEQDAKNRGVPVIIKDTDVAAARAELMRIQEQSPPPIASTPVDDAMVSQSQDPLPKQSKAKARTKKNKPRKTLFGSRRVVAEKLTISTGDKEFQSQELEFPEHTEVSPPVAKTGQTASNPINQPLVPVVPPQASLTQAIGPITGQNLSQQQPQTMVMPPTSPTNVPTLKAPVPKAPIDTTPQKQVAKRSPTPNSYNAALNLYKNKQYKKAELAFDAFLKANPEGTLAPNALYWKGETFYARGDYPQAIFAFKEVQTRYPKHPKAPDSLLKTAMSYGQIGDTENANLHYLVLKEDFPNSTAAKRIPK